MRIDFYGLTFEAPQVSFHLWSPWRSSALEHRLYEAVLRALGSQPSEKLPDEWQVRVSEPKHFRTAIQAAARVLKGWQEEADPGSERRSWRWLLEGDTDHDGYDHNGEPATLWGIIRVSVDRSGPGEADKGEDLDLEGFGVRIWGEKIGG